MIEVKIDWKANDGEAKYKKPFNLSDYEVPEKEIGLNEVYLASKEADIHKLSLEQALKLKYGDKFNITKI